MTDEHTIAAELFRFTVHMTVPAGMSIDGDRLADGVMQALSEYDDAEQFFGSRRLPDGDGCLLRLSVENNASERSTFQLGHSLGTELPYWNAIGADDEALYLRLTTRLKERIDRLDAEHQTLIDAYYRAKTAGDRRKYENASDAFRRLLSSASELAPDEIELGTLTSRVQP